ncbi:hypothetical protein A2272_06915 [Candidatus Peregrinibacteria bacterium RIFOXYA12_FULL_33_12]|nr:MAG: hypothetical protein A2263_03000 [Candidatus Peregrinibacteria bacterium RIFOXYA2_FULL_33_21]OGJ45186.1 MAG: hypothetical protein A2272_06915 [Candidatus Peregrinibacteria bacterium RIFOXYA12_FULL_33_12]OGJ51710.1 MAG: hypothetical protein A2307_05380 [Candidatus Peregrinibacteria bacterium RIFOXYB2_FULL_33_20]
MEAETNSRLEPLEGDSENTSQAWDIGASLEMEISNNGAGVDVKRTVITRLEGMDAVEQTPTGFRRILNALLRMEFLKFKKADTLTLCSNILTLIQQSVSQRNEFCDFLNKESNSYLQQNFILFIRTVLEEGSLNPSPAVAGYLCSMFVALYGKNGGQERQLYSQLFGYKNKAVKARIELARSATRRPFQLTGNKVLDEALRVDDYEGTAAPAVKVAKPASALATLASLERSRENREASFPAKVAMLVLATAATVAVILGKSEIGNDSRQSIVAQDASTLNNGEPSYQGSEGEHVSLAEAKEDLLALGYLANGESSAVSGRQSPASTIQAKRQLQAEAGTRHEDTGFKEGIPLYKLNDKGEVDGRDHFLTLAQLQNVLGKMTILDLEGYVVDGFREKLNDPGVLARIEQYLPRGYYFPRKDGSIQPASEWMNENEFLFKCALCHYLTPEGVKNLRTEFTESFTVGVQNLNTQVMPTVTVINFEKPSKGRLQNVIPSYSDSQLAASSLSAFAGGEYGAGMGYMEASISQQKAPIVRLGIPIKLEDPKTDLKSFYADKSIPRASCNLNYFSAHPECSGVSQLISSLGVGKGNGEFIITTIHGDQFECSGGQAVTACRSLAARGFLSDVQPADEATYDLPADAIQPLGGGEADVTDLPEPLALLVAHPEFAIQTQIRDEVGEIMA